MTTEDAILDAMTTFGGGFVQQLARLYRVADPINRARIRATWGGLLGEQYRELSRRREGRT